MGLGRNRTSIDPSLLSGCLAITNLQMLGLYSHVQERCQHVQIVELLDMK